MSFVAIRGLEKTYPGGTRAVRGIDLDIAEGEFVVLLGPSGCGKTTTLRMLAGLELPTAGTIELAGREVTHLRPALRDIGFVFQFYGLYPHMTVAENVAFPLECAGVPREERQNSVRFMLERLGLEPLASKYPRTLSGGDQQRVALARAMVRRPALSLMDEPLGTLDAERRAEMAELIRAQQIQQRVTTVYVTHDQEEAMRLADRIVVMSGGEIQQAASPMEVYDSPANRFVAHFVGSPAMNELRGRVEGGRFVCGGAELGLAPAAAATGEVLLGVRPEHVVLGDEGHLRGEVLVDEYVGSARFVYVQTAVGRITARVGAAVPWRPGAAVALKFDGKGVRWFDAATGRRLP